MIVVLGPTASGKTRLATHLAHRLNGEVISADSRQVFRGMNIGTGKDLDEYIVDNQVIPHHLIDILDAGKEYNLHQFQQDFADAYRKITDKARLPILCGGSGLYLEAVLKNYEYTAVPINPELRQNLEKLSYDDLLQTFQNTPSEYSSKADVSTRKRLIRAIEISQYLSSPIANRQPLPTELQIRADLPFTIFGLELPTETRRERITKRLHERLQNGMIDEVRSLINNGISPEKLIFYGLEYKFITQYLLGKFDYETMVVRLNVAIHQFAKRQMTYFRKMERGGLNIHWLDAEKPINELIQEVQNHYK